MEKLNFVEIGKRIKVKRKELRNYARKTFRNNRPYAIICM